MTKVNGLSELQANIAALQAELPSVTDGAAYEVAEAAAEEMRDRVRVDTGALRDSIRVEGEAGQYMVGPGDEEKDKALANEFGTRHMAAQPYVVPAMESQRNTMAQVVADAIEGTYP